MRILAHLVSEKLGNILVNYKNYLTRLSLKIITYTITRRQTSLNVLIPLILWAHFKYINLFIKIVVLGRSADQAFKPFKHIKFIDFRDASYG